MRKRYKKIITFKEYFESNSTEFFCILRHDVDRILSRALQMAILENKLGIKSTYYFRMKPYTFKKDIIKKIEDLGHEIGYHYECLSDSDGDFEKSFEDFSVNLRRLRKITNVSTISMHAAPLSKYDNREMWGHNDFHSRLKNELKILGEVYLDIDYSDIIYITDSGRNWISNENNLRDYVNSRIDTHISPNKNLLNYFKTAPLSKIIFSTHPERWPSSRLGFYQSLFLDRFFNSIKNFIQWSRN